MADVRSSFTRPDAVTAADTGVYQFEKLPSFVYLARDTETEGEGDDAVTSDDPTADAVAAEDGR